MEGVCPGHTLSTRPRYAHAANKSGRPTLPGMGSSEGSVLSFLSTAHTGSLWSSVSSGWVQQDHGASSAAVRGHRAPASSGTTLLHPLAPAPSLSPFPSLNYGIFTTIIVPNLWKGQVSPVTGCRQGRQHSHCPSPTRTPQGQTQLYLGSSAERRDMPQPPSLPQAPGSVPTSGLIPHPVPTMGGEQSNR